MLRLIVGFYTRLERRGRRRAPAVAGVGARVRGVVSCGVCVFETQTAKGYRLFLRHNAKLLPRTVQYTILQR